MTLVKPAMGGLEPEQPLQKKHRVCKGGGAHIYTFFCIHKALLIKCLHLYIYLLHRGLDYSTPWRSNYEASRVSLRRLLHITHPVMSAVLALWEKHKDMLFLDLSNVR